MDHKIKISIPKPCHENWQNMTPADRGRFCAACQKTVVDFTRATDREIVAAYNRDEKLCGRFLNTQLDRELVIPKEKNSLWAGAAALAALSLGSAGALAQTPQTETEQHVVKGKFMMPGGPKTITGTVTDQDGLPLPGATVSLQSGTVSTDLNGMFSIRAAVGNVLSVEYQGYLKTLVTITAQDTYTICLEPDGSLMEEVIIMGYSTQKHTITMGAITTVPAKELQTKRRTFVGRILHGIGSIFK
ncbi:hypothetical protein AM493_02215 [Flavobacterium akiainvivens]|uniref:TonB-dependent receptor plug domain-containing protein n=1 Tax=Flavobacterium akiainvivens TaxID=1202724 RepID=A0A0M8M8Y2_9FLAO|nr:carboxypeptidase-like regulatory domain-containing protein [Flavobacterium akiainvivens]KOS04985.1 hypothetical protein AM493_02215 [Flavobacterium akiainvivens]SFQ40964.1 CarboxypepD_reg-like domain-containing protein [Flavobacterium akiainvivens]